MHYSDATKARSGWAEELLQEFRSNVKLLKQAVKDHGGESPTKTSPQGSPQHIQTGIYLIIVIMLYNGKHEKLSTQTLQSISWV